MTNFDSLPRGFIIGAGAHGQVVVEAWRQQHPQRSLAFLDDQPTLWGRSIHGVQVAGGIELVDSMPSEAVVALGANPLRRKLAERWGTRATWAHVIHPSATVATTASIGLGAMILAGAIVNTGAHVGEHVVVNSGAIIEHDCVLEAFSSMSPGVSLGGRVTIGEGAFLSVGVTVGPRVKIGAGTVVGAGAVVVHDLPAGVLAFGVPARVVRELGSDFDWGRLL